MKKLVPNPFLFAIATPFQKKITSKTAVILNKKPKLNCELRRKWYLTYVWKKGDR